MVVVLQVFTYGSVGGGLLSDKYVETEPKKGLFGKSHMHSCGVPVAVCHCAS